MKRVEMESGDNNDLIFRIGEWQRNCFLRLCTFAFLPISFGILISLQS